MTPVIKTIIQAKNKYYLQSANSNAVNISNVCISDGGLLNWNSAVASNTSVTFTNVFNQQGSPNGGMYFVMLWPPVDAHGNQTAIPKLVWDNSAINNPVVQGSAECAFRGKCDDATIRGVTFKAFLQPNGEPYKQILEIRHGKSWLFENCVFQDGWLDIGQQQIAQPNGTSVWDTTQHVGQVQFTNCKFTRLTASNDYIHRDPGVGKIIYTNCVAPSGKTFTQAV